MQNHRPVESSKTSNQTSLSLKNAGGRRVELTVSQVEHLFAELKASLPKASKELDPSSAEFSAQLLKLISRSGLKNAREFITFLKSQGGKSVITMIGEHQLAELTDLQHRREESLERRVRRHHIAIFLLCMFYRRKARAHHKKEIDEKIQNEQLKRAAEIAKAHQYQSEATHVYPPLHIVQLNIKAYIDAAKTVLDIKLQEAELLEKALESLALRIQQTDKKYELYEQHLESLANFIPRQLDLLNTEKREKLLAELINKQRMLEDIIIGDTEIIQKMVDEDADEQIIREMMEVSIAQNIQIGAIADMIDVLKGTKILLTASGEPTLSFSDASFIVPSNQPKKIAKIDDSYLLLSANQDVNKLTPSEINKARLDYEKVKTEVMGVKQLLAYNHGLEQKNNHANRATLSLQAEEMQNTILALVNEITTIQASSANANSISAPLLQMTPTPPAPALSSTPRTSQTNIPVPRPSSELLSDSYRHMVQLMRTNVSQASIDWLTARLEKNDKLIPQVSQLTAGKPISDKMMDELLKRPDLGRLWVTAASKPPVMLPTTPKLEPVSTAPRPFSTRLTPSSGPRRSE